MFSVAFQTLSNKKVNELWSNVLLYVFSLIKRRQRWINKTGSDLWSSQHPSSWPRRCRLLSPCWRCRDWSTAPDKCSSGCRSWSLPSRGYSGTRRGDRFHDQSTSGPDSPLKTQKGRYLQTSHLIYVLQVEPSKKDPFQCQYATDEYCML